MHARRRAVFVLVAAALAVGGIAIAPTAGSRQLAPLGETAPSSTTTTTCTGSTTTSTSTTTTSTTTTSTTTTSTTVTVPTSVTTPTIPTTLPLPGPGRAKGIFECPTTTTTTTTTTTAPAPPPTSSTTVATTSTTADVSSEDPGSIEIPADQSRATVRPGGDVEVSTNVTDVGDDEEPIAPGTRLEAQVKVAEGDTDPLFTVSAEVEADGSVSFDVTFPEDTEPGVYLVVVVLPGAVDADGNVLRRPRVAIATVVVRGRAGRSAKVDLTVTTSGSAKRADTTSIRYSGVDRYGTARDLATSTFDDVLAPILTTGEAYPDALAASYIAGAMRTPILITPRDTLDADVPSALAALGATGVEIVGGTGAVSDAVVAELEALGYTTTRIGGTDRYDTARQLATLIPAEGVGQLEDKGLTAVLVSGDSYADALSAGPMSYSQGWPVLLSGRATLHPAARSAIEEMGIEHVIVVGGTAAIDEQVVRDLEAAGVTAERLAGADRTLTALAVADFLYDRLSYDANDVALARADDFADALAAAPRAGDEIMPILLVPSPADLGDAARSFIRRHADVLEVIEIVGGTGAVWTSVWLDAMHEAGATGETG